MLSPNAQYKKIIFLVPYPFDTAPGQRFRYEQYLERLRQAGFTVQIKSFLSESTHQILYAPGKSLQKVWGILIGFFKRFTSLPSIRQADYIFIFREASPIGPPIIEWIIAKLFRKKIIYDFDDAIWTTDNQSESAFEQWIRWRSKVAAICSWSYKVSGGNDYLCAYAKQFNTRVVLNPTTIDTEFLHNPELHKKEDTLQQLVIGWTGSHSTLKYVKLIEPVLKQLETTYSNVRILVIADRKPDLDLTRLDFIKWNKENEAIDLQKIDIGIMPLPNDDWTKGKCGFKALQYMAMEIPTVVSSVGVNATIVEHSISGFLATTPADWYSALNTLINNEALRKKMGKSGRAKVIDRYSVASNTSNFLSLFL